MPMSPEKIRKLRDWLNDPDRVAKTPARAPRKIRYAIFPENPGYTALGINVDIASCGETQAEALKNLKEAVHLHYLAKSSPAPKKRTVSKVVSGEFLLHAKAA